MGVQTDAEVIAASLHSPAAFGELFDRHATSIHRYLIRRMGPDDADGVTGDVFRIAFEKRLSYDTAVPNARPWLYGISTNLVARARRSEARRLKATALLAGRAEQKLDEAERATDRLAADDRWQRVAAAIDELPDGERDALLLHAWEGLSYDDVAQALDIPVGTVRSRLNRARARLRELDECRGEQLHELRGSNP